MPLPRPARNSSGTGSERSVRPSRENSRIDGSVSEAISISPEGSRASPSPSKFLPLNFSPSDRASGTTATGTSSGVLPGGGATPLSLTVKASRKTRAGVSPSLSTTAR